MSDDLDEHIKESVNIAVNVSTMGNHIYFYKEVNETTALHAIKAIKKLNIEINTIKLATMLDNNEIYKDDEDTETKLTDSPIYFHINSGGGDYFSGLAIADAIRLSKAPVYTIAEGAVGSMASIIFLSGKKRFINKNAYILIHEIRTFVSGTFSNLTDDFENCKNFMEKMIKFYKDHTKIPKKELLNILKKDIWIDAEKCLLWKFADKIL